MKQNDEKAINAWLVKTGLSDANFWETLVDNNVQCHLCPRYCFIQPGNFGFCNSRYNLNGKLKTAIWGKMLTPSIEPIETEAVFHYWPGSKILSLGNLGCNLKCDFCQNWESSNMKNLSQKFVKYYKPEEVIAIAKAMDIKVISFTYNDPAIWFEYVYETARIAHKNEIKTLFKSAGFISNPVARYLTKVIDIFSISLKSINSATFKNMSKGKLNNVLEATEIFYRSGKHLEISNLVVPGLTDVEQDIKKLVQWIKKNLSEEIPLHFVRFHPAYRYTNVKRTSIEFLEKARKIALELGMKYVYIGNTYEEDHSNIYCKSCGEIMIKRFGLYTEIGKLSSKSKCLNCGETQKIVMRSPNGQGIECKDYSKLKTVNIWKWLNMDTRNLHVEVINLTEEKIELICEHLKNNDEIIDCEVVNIPKKTEIRIAFGQKDKEENKIKVLATNGMSCHIIGLLDRAHFPLEEIDVNCLKNENVTYPISN